jgi:lipoate-protein ligase A
MEGRIIYLEKMPLARYMAISETIQHSVADGYPPTVVIAAGWTENGISIGKDQPIGYVNLEACREDNIPVIRRPTDGYAVFHQHDDVTYGVSLQQSSIQTQTRSVMQLKRAFDRIIIPVLISSLKQVHVEGVHNLNPKRYGNLGVGNRKICGSAQNTDYAAWLQHGIICMRPYNAAQHLRYVNERTDAEALQAQTTSVEEMGGIVDPRALAEALADEFSRQFNDIHLQQSSLTSEEQEYSERLTREKYLSEEWLMEGTKKHDKSGRVSCFTWNAPSRSL